MSGNRGFSRRLIGAAAPALALASPTWAQQATTTPPTAGPVRPYSASLRPYYGNLNAFWGNMNAFSGPLNPFYGNMNAFWGSVSPYYGNLNAFWGDVSPYYGNMSAFASSSTLANGTLKPVWGNLNAFWGEIGPQWGNLNAFWGNLNAFGGTPADYMSLSQQIAAFVDKSRTFWGGIIQSQTGRSFDDGFVAPMLAKWGIDLNNPNNLAALSEADRQRFMLDWHDQLMQYSGADQVDWWMKAINWSPALTAGLGSGVRTKIGLLDFSITGDPGLQDNVVKYDGISTFSNGHGTAVASLIVSPQDGKGVMGIAPMAQVIAYNPFDSTGTANWADVTKGVLMLAKNGATVINMSLGVPGWTFNQGWNDVFTDTDIQKLKTTSVFVIAAGNDGISQTQNIVWDKKNPNFILVGSVDPTGTISSFSNRPGTACLIAKAYEACSTGNRLMDHFIVAPGEMILVSDGNGGVTRMSGTSFAAPLVSGAITLIHNRWPWLQKDPDTTVAILLGTAKDLGEPGPDPVYGMGELDVARAVQPVPTNKLQWYQPNDKGGITKVDITAVTQASAAQKAQWEAAGIYYYLYEDFKSTGNFRDYAVPLSTKLFGQSARAADGTQQQLADWLYKVYVNPTSSGFATARGVSGFSSFSERGGTFGTAEGVELSMSLAPKSRAFGYVQSTMPYQTAVRFGLPGGKARFRFGVGDGAVALGGQRSFGLITDYDVDTGGANPLLGMASGGTYGGIDYAVTPRLTVSAGYTQKRLRRDARFLNPSDLATLGGRLTKAEAQNVAVNYRPLTWLTVHAGLTRVSEDKALLGMQSLDPADFGSGAATNGVTVGADVAIGAGFGMSVTATRGNTRNLGSEYRNLSIAQGGLTSSSYKVALSKDHLIDRRDRIRFSIAQPIHVDSGRMNYTTIQVIDRDEGTLGVVTQSFDLPTPQRQYVGEIVYGRALGSRRDLSLFGRAQFRRSVTPTDTAALMLGARFSVVF